MSEQHPEEQASEDLMAGSSTSEREEEDYESESEDEEQTESDRKAAAALTSFVASSATASSTKSDQQTPHEASEKEFKIPLRFTKSGRKRAVPFPIKLMKVLTEEKNHEIIAWTPSGKSFAVLKPKLFVSEILGRVFRSAKYSSFTRKLHRWGFMRHYRGEEAGTFYHELFVKNRLDLCEKMTCHKEEPRTPSKKAKKTVAPPPPPTPVLACRESVSHMPTMTPRNSLSNAVTNALLQRPLVSAYDLPAASSTMLPTGPAVDLNAAIELEVSRRLKERINQAALSRQAILLLQEQERKTKEDQQLRFQIAIIQQQQQHLQQQQLQQQQQQRFGLSPSVTANLAQHLAALKFNSSVKQKSLPPLQQSFGSNTSGLPPTNIQGAKTA